MEERNVERLLGHSGNWSNAAYDRPFEDWFIEDYLKAVPALTIYKQTITADTVEQTQTLMMQMESKNNEIVELKEQVEDIRYQLEDLIRRNIVVTNMTHDGRIISKTDGYNRPLG